MRKNCSKDVSRERRIEILFVFGVFAYQKLVHGKKDKGTKATA